MNYLILILATLGGLHVLYLAGKLARMRFRNAAWSAVQERFCKESNRVSAQLSYLTREVDELKRLIKK